MDDKRLVKLSKYLSKHLRHVPEALGLTLAPGGWVPVDALLEACDRRNFRITREELEEVVARNNKQRFSFDPGGTLIRANQGHSVEVDLQLEPVEPPAVLYHGTGSQNVEAIQREGLRRMSRHHVHLSGDMSTALNVGARHGRPVVFEVDAAGMHQAGYEFYRSANGVWLVKHVPAEWLALVDEWGV
ncbi:MAG TPA: RNA 2'-phosphotransferase [Chloroflexia bacterium]|jgi:putative RNA 2'-phosphotransferase